jgi:hypothetical protein
MLNTKKELLKTLIGKGCEIEEYDNYINISIGSYCGNSDKIIDVGNEVFKVNRSDIFDYYYNIDHFHSLKYEDPENSKESMSQGSQLFG